MTLAAPRPIPLLENRYTAGLRRQDRRSGGRADVLLILCPEQVAGGARIAEAVGASPALVLELPGTIVRGPGIDAALRTAVCDLGVRRIVVLGHGDCRHDGAAGSPRTPHEAPARRPGGFYDRMLGRIAEARARLDLARGRVRDAIRRIESNPALRARLAEGSLEIDGAVVIPSSGATVWFDRRTDRFVSRPAGTVSHAGRFSSRALG